jgi:hypothetical protein
LPGALSCRQTLPTRDHSHPLEIDLLSHSPA